ncbi:MAG: Trm112 family protein [bacterium]
MPIDPELLELLVCPETRQPVALAPPETLEKVNAEIEAGRLRNRGGDPVEEKIAEGLLREDGRILYIVDDGIPIMLVEQSIELP